MRLPLELCEAIVDYLTPEDRPTLLNCTLVNHFFAVRAQKILFRTISLGRPSTTVDIRLNTVSIKHPSHRFLSILNSSPRLAAYVEEVYITDNDHNTSYREERSWIRQDTVLHTILDKLDRLRGFSIAGNLTGNRLNFKAWHERLKDVILTKCQSSLLTKISLTYLRNVPVSILTQAPALESIYSFNTAYIIDYTTPAQRGDRPKLDCLEITMTSYNDWATFYPWLLDAEYGLDLTALTVLTLRVGRFMRETGSDDVIEPINAIAWAVHQCTATLVSLRLVCPDEVSSNYMAAHPFVDFGAIPRLRALFLHATLWTDQTLGTPNHLPWLIAALRRIPAGMLLSLYCTLDHQEMDPIEVGAADWTGLAQEITRLADAASVDVQVALFEPYAPEVLALIEDRLRDLRVRGIVNVRPVLA